MSQQENFSVRRLSVVTSIRDRPSYQRLRVGWGDRIMEGVVFFDSDLVWVLSQCKYLQ